ncbi:MAG: Glu-tRNA(Gln) amidotransferase subunit GatD [Candidatus Lokiarchaeota archaeon]|nr:Glu-tRNA(Gln) amidotransferase subunit GatD [Candidatus Lokiarchaeota archaeon]
MSDEKPQGYKKRSLEFFDKNDVYAWNEVEITKHKAVYKGILLPRNKFAKDGFVEIKLKNGYNIGIEITDNTKIKVLGKKPPMSVEFQGVKVPKDKNKPNVTLLGTGGTIASRLDYVTGGVIPAFRPHELFAAVPELSDICNLDTEVVFQIFSEDMNPKHWLKLAEKVAKLSNSGVEGIVIGHGTDTMAYSTAALSFLVQNLKCPVVFVGSQRSSDRPSSDAALNLINAVSLAANADLAEVVLCMLGTTSHDYGLFHRGTLVRKMHSSVRHTFRTIGDIPLGKIKNGKITYFKDDMVRKSTLNKKLKTTAYKKIEDKVGLIYIYPGIDTDIVDNYIDKGYKGLVLAGTGLGHTPHTLFDSFKRGIEEGMTIVMTVQTLWGFTGMNVYETGREEQQIGIIPGKNMLPETAYVKLCWVLGNYDDSDKIKEIMQSNVVGEILEGEPENGFQVFQGIE